MDSCEIGGDAVFKVDYLNFKITSRQLQHIGNLCTFVYWRLWFLVSFYVQLDLPVRPAFSRVYEDKYHLASLPQTAV